MESEFPSAFVPLYADVSALSNNALGFTEIPVEVVAGGEEGFLVVPPPAQLAPPLSKESLRMAACQQMLPSVPLAQRRSLDAWPAAPPEVRDAKPMGSHLDEEIKRRWPQAPLRSNTFRTNNDRVNWLYNNTGPPISAPTSGRASADLHVTSTPLPPRASPPNIAGAAAAPSTAADTGSGNRRWHDDKCAARLFHAMWECKEQFLLKTDEDSRSEQRQRLECQPNKVAWSTAVADKFNDATWTPTLITSRTQGINFDLHLKADGGTYVGHCTPDKVVQELSRLQALLRKATSNYITSGQGMHALPSDEEKYTHMYKNFGSDFWNFCQGLHHLLYMYEFFLPPRDILERVLGNLPVNAQYDGVSGRLVLPSARAMPRSTGKASRLDVALEGVVAAMTRPVKLAKTADEKRADYNRANGLEMQSKKTGLELQSQLFTEYNKLKADIERERVQTPPDDFVITFLTTQLDNVKKQMQHAVTEAKRVGTPVFEDDVVAVEEARPAGRRASVARARSRDDDDDAEDAVDAETAEEEGEAASTARAAGNAEEDDDEEDEDD